jgi:TonB family protein
LTPTDHRQAQGPELAEGQLPLRVAFALGVLLASILPAQSGSSPVEPPQLWSLVVTAVRPEYPYAAKRSGFHGRGILVGEVDFQTGAVTSVKMEKSTNSTILDQAALDAFRQWKFKPKALRRFRVPIVFTMGQGA